MSAQIFYYMRDNHTFKRLETNEAIALAQIEHEFDLGWTGGMLCSEDNTIFVHAHGRKKRGEFLAACRKELASMSANA